MAARPHHNSGAEVDKRHIVIAVGSIATRVGFAGDVAPARVFRLRHDDATTEAASNSKPLTVGEFVEGISQQQQQQQQQGSGSTGLGRGSTVAGGKLGRYIGQLAAEAKAAALQQHSAGLDTSGRGVDDSQHEDESWLGVVLWICVPVHWRPSKAYGVVCEAVFGSFSRGVVRGVFICGEDSAAFAAVGGVAAHGLRRGPSQAADSAATSHRRQNVAVLNLGYNTLSMSLVHHADNDEEKRRRRSRRLKRYETRVMPLGAAAHAMKLSGATPMHSSDDNSNDDTKGSTAVLTPLLDKGAFAESVPNTGQLTSTLAAMLGLGDGGKGEQGLASSASGKLPRMFDSIVSAIPKVANESRKRSRSGASASAPPPPKGGPPPAKGGTLPGPGGFSGTESSSSPDTSSTAASSSDDDDDDAFPVVNPPTLVVVTGGISSHTALVQEIEAKVHALYLGGHCRKRRAGSRDGNAARTGVHFLVHPDEAQRAMLPFVGMSLVAHLAGDQPWAKAAPQRGPGAVGKVEDHLSRDICFTRDDYDLLGSDGILWKCA